MARRKLRINFEIDERTDTLSDAALLCRSIGHLWVQRSQSTRRFREMARLGLMEYDRVCDNGCGSTWRQVWDISQRRVVEDERRYPPKGEYLLPPQTGRLPRGEAVAGG